jgi:REP element-mobilizing transposase RayT
VGQASLPAVFPEIEIEKTAAKDGCPTFAAILHVMDRVFYRRRLPHWQPAQRALFLTWRLYGSLPRRRHHIADGEAFVEFDRLLDERRSGPMWLHDPRIARLVFRAFLYGQKTLRLYGLETWVILGNHVHLLIEPQASPSRITGALKGYTASEANKLLDRTGQPFWEDESFDHWVRSPEEFRRIARYIEQNPVKARLATSAEEWPWSSANPNVKQLIAEV